MEFLEEFLEELMNKFSDKLAEVISGGTLECRRVLWIPRKLSGAIPGGSSLGTQAVTPQKTLGRTFEATMVENPEEVPGETGERILGKIQDFSNELLK